MTTFKDVAPRSSQNSPGYKTGKKVFKRFTIQTDRGIINNYNVSKVKALRNTRGGAPLLGHEDYIQAGVKAGQGPRGRKNSILV